jgi:hypothetical protein
MMTPDIKIIVIIRKQSHGATAHGRSGPDTQLLASLPLVYRQRLKKIMKDVCSAYWVSQL